MNNFLHVACNYHYLGWVLTWKYLKQGFWYFIEGWNILQHDLNKIQEVLHFVHCVNLCCKYRFPPTCWFGICSRLDIAWGNRSFGVKQQSVTHSSFIKNNIAGDSYKQLR
jgi:hypothetical protein